MNRERHLAIGITTGFLVVAPIIPDPLSLGVLGSLVVISLIAVFSRIEKKHQNAPPPLK